MTIEPNVRHGLVRRVRNASLDTDDDNLVDGLPPLVTPSAISDSNDEYSSDGVTPTSDSPMPPAVMGALMKRQGYYARAGFRQRRAKAFEAKKGFPALVNAKLVPEWRECNPHQSEEDIDSHARLSHRHRARARLVAPTLAGAVRQQVKRPPSPQTPWLPHNGVNEVQRMYSRSPCLFNHTYRGPVEMLCRDESPDAKRQWMGEHTILPASSAQAKTTIARPAGRNGFEIEQEVNDIRSRGRAKMEELQNRYERKAEAFKDEQARRGPLSGFASYELKHKRKKKDIFKIADITNRDRVTEKRSIYSFESGFRERVSVGFSRYRQSRRHITSD